MKRRFTTTAALALAFAFATMASADTWKGLVSDSRCGAKGASKADHKDCLAKGEKAVFVKDGKVYKLDEKGEKTARELAGREVDLTGTLKEDTITVEKIGLTKTEAPKTEARRLKLRSPTPPSPARSRGPGLRGPTRDAR